MTNLENCKHSVHRTRGITARFQVSSSGQNHVCRRSCTGICSCYNVSSLPLILTLTQWLHEESLILPDSHYPWVGPQRSMLLTTIKKVRCRRLTTQFDSLSTTQLDTRQGPQQPAFLNPTHPTLSPFPHSPSHPLTLTNISLSPHSPSYPPLTHLPTLSPSLIISLSSHSPSHPPTLSSLGSIRADGDVTDQCPRQDQ